MGILYECRFSWETHLYSSILVGGLEHFLFFHILGIINPIHYLGNGLRECVAHFCRVAKVLQVKVSYFLLTSTVCHGKWPRNMEDDLQLLVTFHDCVKFAEVYLP